MLIGICGDYFNAEEIRHIWAESDSTIVVELKNNDEYYLDYSPFNDTEDNLSINDYLQQIVNGINMIYGRNR